VPSVDRQRTLGAPFVPDVEGRVGERPHVVEQLLAQGERRLVQVGVQHADVDVRSGPDQVGEHARHRGDPDPRAAEDQRTAGVVEHDVAEGQREGDDIADVHALVEEVRDFALGPTAPAHPFDRELATLAVVGSGEAVLPRLTGAVGHPHPQAHVLAGERGPHGPVVGPLDPEGHDVVGLLEPLLDLPLPPHDLRAYPAGAVETAFHVGERERHQPVDLAPGRGHLGGDGVADNVADRPHEVVVDDLVLVRPQAERSVLVRDPRQQAVRQPVGVVHQGAGEHGHGLRQGSLLGAFGLVAAVEHPVEKFRVLAEQVPVEPLGDLPDVLPDHRQGRRDDGPGLLGQRQHRSFLPPRDVLGVPVSLPRRGAPCGSPLPFSRAPRRPAFRTGSGEPIVGRTGHPAGVKPATCPRRRVRRMIRQRSREDDPHATYEIGLLGSVPESLRRRHPPMDVRTTPAQTLLVRHVGRPEELDELLEQLSSMGLVLTEIHARVSASDADPAIADADLDSSERPAGRQYEVRVLGQLGERLLRHLGWAHCALPEQHLACGDATADELSDFLAECSRLGLVIERVHRAAASEVDSPPGASAGTSG
jgi:hypothetical protein